ncbi:hypothetical protein [Marinovum sp.]|uniref:hypothetical protein n=1 Tax=Marinovum sp. TaxID=2024839 RepID=UPI003A9222B6
MTSSNLPAVVADLQARVESLYAQKVSLEQEVAVLRAMPPVVLQRPPRPGLVMRGLMRLWPRLRRRFHLRVIRESGLFDARWYHEAYPDVAAAGGDAALHFLTHGGPDRRDPGPHFDTGHYLRLYPDIAAMEINPLVHYVMAGRSEERSIRPGMPHGGW